MIYNRNLKVEEYWLSTPLGFWWDGRNCVNISEGRFIKGKYKSYSSQITCKPDELDKHLRIARVAYLRAGQDRGNAFLVQIEKLPYRHGKRNRFMTDYVVGGIYVRKYPV